MSIRVLGCGLQTPFTAEGLGADVTVQEVLDVARAQYQGLVISVNGVPVSLSARVKDGDVITGATSVKGARG
jgi:hypothetical protein